MSESVPKFEASVDYVTLTLPATAREISALRFRRHAEDALDDAGPMAERRGAQVLGYRGQKLGSVFYGARPGGWLFRSSGSGGNSDYCRDWPTDVRCTRIDLQVTVWREPWQGDAARKMAASAVAARDAGLMHRATRVCFYDGCGDGDSCYIGSRSSEQMLRLYDKGKQSDETRYNGSWRWEIEFKGERADQAREALCEAPDAVQTIVGTVEDWLLSRGVGYGPGIGGAGGIRVVVPRGQDDDSARLDWLARSVAPMLGRLIDRVGKDRVYSALSLDG